MIKRFYVNNFRCLQNFSLNLSGIHSSLLIGKNGAGKTSVGFALEILQKIARGTNRIGDLVKTSDRPRWNENSTMRFEIEVELSNVLYEYHVAFDLPVGSKEFRVAYEKLVAKKKIIYNRQEAQVTLYKTADLGEAKFLIDWHLAALPIVQENSPSDPLAIFKKWLAHALILRPIPSLIYGNSSNESLQPTPELSDFGDWFTALMAFSPSAYSKLDHYVKEVIKDFKDIQNPFTGTETRSLIVNFANTKKALSLPFKELSDGEKCFFICAMVLASNDAYGPIFCFWDEPDSHLALSEVSHFIVTLRRIFQENGQFIMTSHNHEAISRFSSDNTFVLSRLNHSEPTEIRTLSEFNLKNDLLTELTTGDLS